MDAKSEVILRQIQYLTAKTLLINPPQDQLTTALAPLDVVLWTWNFADYQYFKQAGYTAYFEISPSQERFEHAIIFIPKAKEQLNYVLEQCAALLAQGKDIFLVGEKKAGIERAAKQLQPYGKATKLDSARHCQLWHIRTLKQISARPLEHWIKTYHYTSTHVQLSICALPGVFSQDHLDIGTAQLIPFLEQLKSGTALDFGCGAGVISAILAKLDHHRKIIAADIDAFALKSTELTFAHNQLSTQLNIQAISDIQDLKQNFDVIVSNPPFHQGIKTHYQASENLCQFAHNHLNPQGELWIVANRFLNYSTLIEQQFGHCQIKTDQNGFKVLYAQK